MAKAKVQIFLLHMKTLKPSRIPKGIKLKKAIQALKKAPIKSMAVIVEVVARERAIVKKAVDNTIFVAGPAMDIFPIRDLSAYPATMTAPGDMILNIIGSMETNVRTAPMRVNLNSAHNPCFCAVILCAISCMKKDAVKIMAKLINNAGSSPIPL